MLLSLDFRAKIQSSGLILLFDYWQAIRRDRPMPNWSDIKPEEIAPVLSSAWAWRLAEDGHPRIRLVGERIVATTSRNIRAATPEDLFPPTEAAEIRSRLLRVMTVPTCSLTVGDVFDGPTRISGGERLSLPYADLHGGRGVVGASWISPDTKTGAPIPFKPKTLYRLQGTEYFMNLPATDKDP